MWAEFPKAFLDKQFVGSGENDYARRLTFSTIGLTWLLIFSIIGGSDSRSSKHVVTLIVVRLAVRGGDFLLVRAA